LHEDHKPSFLVDTNKDLFYCYGCGSFARFCAVFQESVKKDQVSIGSGWWQ
jgi:DNA primase